MPTYSSNRGNFTPPPAGLHRAVCVDIIDLGERQTSFGIKPQVRVVWLLDAKMDDGRPFYAQSTFTNSMHPKSLLHQTVVGWRGRPFTEEDMARMAKGPGFDLDQLIGRNCQIQIMHESRDGNTYGNVKAVLPPSSGAPALTIPHDYVRKQSRPQNGGSRGATEPISNDGWEDVPPPTDAELPALVDDQDLPF